jgi:predicted homoserine dehydrogenase-like protein
VLRPIRKGETLSWDDVAMDRTINAYKIRAEMEASFGPNRRPDLAGVA